MAGRNHHTVPKFLLKGFASSIRGKVTNVWMYRKGQEGIQLNIENVGAERDFYGKPSESDLDSKITALENIYSSWVAGLQTGEYPDGRLDDSRIPELIVHFALRTRSLRASFIDTTVSIADDYRKHLTNPQKIRGDYKKHFGKDEIVRKMRAELKTRGLTPVEIERILIKEVPKFARAVDLMIDKFVSEQAPEMDSELQKAMATIPHTLRTSMIEGLREDNRSSMRIERYSRYKWFVVTPELPLILGDTICLFKRAAENSFRSLDHNEDQAKQIILPLAKNRLIVGTMEGACPTIDVREVNSAIAKCSLEFFVSSRRLPDSDSSLAEMLGQEAGVFTDAEKRSVLQGLSISN